MNREIEFRGIREDNKEWVYGWLAEPNVINVEVRDESVGYYAIEDILVIPETVGQWTGFQDAEEKKIYEGDILRLYYKEKNTQKEKTLWVEFENGNYVLKSSIGVWGLLGRLMDVISIKYNGRVNIIGNIHEEGK